MPKKGSVKSVIPVVLVPSLPLFKPINPPINAIINKMRKPEASILFVFNHFSFGRPIYLLLKDVFVYSPHLEDG